MSIRPGFPSLPKQPRIPSSSSRKPKLSQLPLPPADPTFPVLTVAVLSIMCTAAQLACSLAPIRTEHARVLPNCSHALFHLDCIDMWHQSNFPLFEEQALPVPQRFPIDLVASEFFPSDSQPLTNGTLIGEMMIVW
ncbi:hypothetical protein SLEP1_g861 [Rubroshorea leprosula]|uniref:RING-type domain-containing protein n=1 Tax=Rubroshorea leprosula TaxID=152421 RepID=A0AAV5HKY0_9ROSI|nr:hypothetical protein SLEP1_g861 [Rubroshorea leprosula]